ncbi:hypothetical protein AB0B21_38675 [Streptomyces rimosus]|uniref:hypothetical protein n=1 Tax=Streptomyces rimosus TaxID=1927 RepID=UPI001F171F94|nr:hypothetical protein [Streptomyces rimosus]
MGGSIVGVGRGPELAGVCPQAFADGLWCVGGQLVDFVGSLAQEASVGVGADGVATAGAAVVLPRGGRSGVGFAERVVAFDRADQERVGVVEECNAILGEELGCLLGERLGDDAALEVRCLRGSSEGPTGRGPGGLLSGSDVVKGEGGAGHRLVAWMVVMSAATVSQP